MKELGEYLKKAREDNGVEIEEAAEDIKVSEQVLNNVESGNTRAFRDILELKEIVRSYSKYLGLDSEKVIDEFNDFMFEHTSKISLADILEAEKKSNEKNKKSISSPYTKPYRPQINVKYLKLFGIIIIVLLFLIMMLIVLKTLLFPERIVNKELLNKSRLKGELYEYTK